MPCGSGQPQGARTVSVSPNSQLTVKSRGTGWSFPQTCSRLPERRPSPWEEGSGAGVTVGVRWQTAGLYSSIVTCNHEGAAAGGGDVSRGGLRGSPNDTIGTQGK